MQKEGNGLSLYRKFAPLIALGLVDFDWIDGIAGLGCFIGVSLLAYALSLIPRKKR